VTDATPYRAATYQVYRIERIHYQNIVVDCQRVDYSLGGDVLTTTLRLTFSSDADAPRIGDTFELRMVEPGA
jgi:hypothetical protein